MNGEVESNDCFLGKKRAHSSSSRIILFLKGK